MSIKSVKEDCLTHHKRLCYILPVYKRWFEAVHQHNRNVHFHSDGNVTEILSDLAQMGVDELNLQCGAMDIDALASVCRDKVCLRGELHRQKVPPHFSPGCRRRRHALDADFYQPEGKGF